MPPTEQLLPLRFCFHQDIFRLPDEKPIVHAKVIGTALNERGRPQMPEVVERLLNGVPSSISSEPAAGT